MRALSMFLLAGLLVFGCTAQKPAQTAGENETIIPEAECIDSDGLDIFSAGQVSIGNDTYTDECVNQSVLKEYYCNGNSLGERSDPCPSGKVCEEGGCVTAPEMPLPEPDCVDTDGGADYHSNGSVAYEDEEYPDVCQGNYDLLEYFCLDDKIGSETHHCNPGEKCQDGACLELEKTCSDSDSKSPSSSGTTIQYGGGVVIDTKKDFCIDDNSKMEYYCKKNLLANKTESCQEGTECMNGACLSPCQDKDGGKDYETASTASDRSGSYGDYCISDRSVLEFFCDGEELSDIEYVCESYCKDGRCLSGSDISCKDITTGAQIKYKSDVLIEELDSCLNVEILRQYFCNEGEIEYLNTACDDEELCYDGKCVAIAEEACFDLDIGEYPDDIHVASSAVKTDNNSIIQTKQDSCLNDATLIEYRCDGKNFKADYVECPSGEECQGSKCVYPYTCSDSDGGKNLEAGSATLWEGYSVYRSERDGCVDDDTIFETYCTEDNHIAYAHLDCPSGTLCDPETGSCS